MKSMFKSRKYGCGGNLASTMITPTEVKYRKNQGENLYITGLIHRSLQMAFVTSDKYPDWKGHYW
jgi:hypothetical protein